MTEDILTSIQKTKKFLNGNITDLKCDEIDFSYSRSFNSVIKSTSLDSSNFSHVNWKSTHFENTSLNNLLALSARLLLCTFEQVSAVNANFGEATIENCKAQACIFDKANFTNASLTDSDFNRASFKEADLTKTDASYCNMRGVDFRGAMLINTNFRDADLRGADFTGAVLDNTDFRGANIDGALFDPEASQAAREDASVKSGDQIVELSSIVNPVVNNILSAACDKNILDKNKSKDELDRIMRSFGSSGYSSENVKGKSEKETVDLDSKISNIMNQAASVGIGPMLESLQQQGGEPPLAVKKMIESLIKDFDLGNDATAEDLLDSMVSAIQKK